MNLKTLVLDSWPLIEWIFGREPIVRIVNDLLQDAEAGNARLLMSAINVGEIYYFLHKNGRSPLAEEWRESAATLPVTIEVPNSADIWSAAEIKANFPLSYADAFAAGMSRKYGCPLMTGDAEFRKVRDLAIYWVGA